MDLFCDLPVGQALEVEGQDLGFQVGQSCPDRLLQRAEIFRVDDSVLRVALGRRGAKTLEILMSQNEGRIKRNGFVQRGVLSARSGPDHREQAAADAGGGEGAEPGAPAGVLLPDGRDEADHPLLDEIFAVSPRQKERAGAHAHEARVAVDQCFFCSAVPLGRLSAEKLIRIHVIFSIFIGHKFFIFIIKYQAGKVK